jgi:hypothetical protein
MDYREIFFVNYTIFHLLYYFSYIQDVQETVFVSLIHRVTRDVDAEDAGKVNVVKDVGLYGCGVIRIYRHLMVSVTHKFQNMHFP